METTYLKHLAAPASALLKAMGNPHRFLMLCHLADGECSVGQLEGLIGLSQSALSQHLAKLRSDDLVRTRRDRQTIYYSLNGHDVRAVLRTLAEVYRGRHGATHPPNQKQMADASA